MARLINAENYRDLFNEEFKKTMELIRKGETHLDTLAEGFTEADRVIRALPTIDPVHAAGACYCRECKYARKVDKQEPKYKCVNICRDGCTQWLGSDDFCSHGQRLEDTK